MIFSEVRKNLKQNVVWNFLKSEKTVLILATRKKKERKSNINEMLTIY